MSSKSRKGWRAGVLAAGIGLAATVALTPAAADSYVINYDVTCHVFEQVELQGSPAHDYMRWWTGGDSDGCEAAVFSNGGDYYDGIIITTGTAYSGWVYDGPGYTDQVKVWDRNDVEVDGPSN